MAKILIECENPNDYESVGAAIEKYVGRCNITYAKQAAILQESGIVKSERQAATHIARETGENPGSVRNMIQRGRAKMAAGAANKSNNEIKSEVYYDPQEGSITHPLTDRGGVRDGAGRPPTPNGDEWIKLEDELESKIRLIIQTLSELSNLKEWKKNKERIIHRVQTIIYYASERK